MHHAEADGVRRVRLVGWVEGVSYLLLLGIAMPLKYFAGLPLAVKIVGWAHGALFVLLAAVAFDALVRRRISFGQASLVGVASLLPFGPFLIDRRLGAQIIPKPRRCGDCQHKAKRSP